MQTFVPYPDAARSVATLDNRRLGKQRVETFQLLLWLHGVRVVDWESRILAPRMSGWSHPALRMWAGHERALLRYQDATCDEWTARGFNDTCKEKSHFVVDLMNSDLESETWPEWWGDDEIHMRHRSNLVWKDRAYYGPQFPDDVPKLPVEDPELRSSYFEYHWPDGRIDFRERIAFHYAKAVDLLGLPDPD